MNPEQTSNAMQAVQTNGVLKLFPLALTQFFASPVDTATKFGLAYGTSAGQETGKAINETVTKTVENATTGFKNLGLWVLVVLFIVLALFVIKK